ncbi:MAG TPA: type I polyketide synthase [Mycobacterium sp.]|nr:type I polyketide synthase [Mycobacterium sp.]
MTAAFDEAALRHWLVDYLVTNIGCSPEDIDFDASMHDLGLGSADAVVLTGELSELLGRQISPVEFWQYPTISALARFLSGSEPESAADAMASSDRGSLDEPIAVIGVGCRFPGDIVGPESLWRFLSDGRSSVAEVPPDRWALFDDGSPEAAAALSGTTRWGSFLTDIDAFDAEFFEISPREAAKMDPQQRLLLEVAYEALEHAGIVPSSLRHSQTGVFAGACVSEYGYLASTDLSQVDAWSGTGGALSIIANRVSYFLDLRGPSVTVDTACSSSLVGIHLACQSLRTGESNLAIAAGVNLLLSPAVTRSFDQAEAMSPTGGCHSFDASADGFVRGEGCGAVVLKRLSDALRDGDRVLAVVRGSAVNQDGRSNGLMAPNPAAQMAVLRAAYANAGVEPREVDYVEAHGTGTLLGDPIEARALGTVLGRGRPETSPLLIGAVKSNLGHLEAAAGIAGFIKAVLAVHRGHIPANLHFENPNPHIPFADLRLKVVADPTGWPSVQRPRRAGVSSFGFGGTNAHVVLEQAPDLAPLVVDNGPVVSTLVVSGKTPERVALTAGVLADWMDGEGADVALADVAHTLNHHRTRQSKFAAVCARDRDQAVAGLRALAAGRSADGVVAPHQGACRPGTVFVYSGQGSQWAGMGRQLMADEPVFAAAVAELEPIFVERVGFSLRRVLDAGEPVSGIARIQPVLVGMQLALTKLWRSHGVEPDAVIGHSMGEVTAAVVAGALSAAEGLRVIATRSRLMSRLSGQGAMALLELDPESAESLIAAYPDVTLAVYASPRQSVIAGPPEQVDAVIAMVGAQERLARRIEVDVASHHPTIDPILPELRSALSGLAPTTPMIPILTTTYDQTGAAPVFDADYWASNLRNPVRFSHAVADAAADHATFVEVSPHPLLTHAISDTLGRAHHHSIGTLLRDTDDTVTFHTNLNATHTVHPPNTDHAAEPHPVLPTTPWQHTRHWITIKKRVDAAGSAPRSGVLLGDHITVATTPPTHLWQARLVPEAKPYPGSHRIHGVEVVPVSVLLQTLSAAAAECGASLVSDVRFEHPIVVGQPQVIQVIADGESVTVSSAPAADTPAYRWVRHVSARISHRQVDDEPEVTDDSGDHGTPGYDISSVAELQRTWGIEGQPFPWSIGSCRSVPGGLHVDVGLPEASTVALLDAAVHVARLVDGSNPRLMVPAAVESVRLETGVADARGSVEVRRRGGNGDELLVDIAVKALDGSTCVDIRSLRYADVESGPAQAAPRNGDPRALAHAIEWQRWDEHADLQQALDAPCTLAVLGESDAARTLRDRLIDDGYTAAGIDEARCVVYVAEPSPEHPGESDFDCAVRLSAAVTDLVSRLAERGDHYPATLWIITRGVRGALSDAASRQSCLWGLAGVIGAEQPQLWGGLVDIPVCDDIGDCASVLSTLLPTAAKSILELRDGEFLAPALVPVSGQPVREPLRCRPDAAYLITGGMGALGLLMAAWLADRGARRLVLAGRTPLPPRRDWDSDTMDRDVRHKIAAIRALEMRGVSIDAVALDVGSRDAVQALLATRDRDGGAPILGVIHAAGVTESQLLTEITDSRLRRTMWPKIAGAQALHEAFPPATLDFFFLTASAGTVFGIPGQGAYAAANAYLDCLAQARHRQGCHTVSLDWAAWQGLGFGADAQVVVQELQRLGSRPVTPEEAFTAWEYVNRYDVAQAVMAPMPTTEESASVISDAHRNSTPMPAWSQMSPDDLHAELENGLRAILATELRMPETELQLDLPFAELGLNSVMAMSIRREAEQLVGMELSATMLWNHPTIASLAEYLANKLLPQEDSEGDVDVTADSPSNVLDALFDSVESAPAGSESGMS